MSSQRLRANDLRKKSRDELEKQLAELKQELTTVRVSKVAGASGSVKVGRIRQIRKSIARVLTIMNQMQKENLIKLYQHKKYKPIDLRPRLTRALRRRLTPYEAKKKTRRTIRRERLSRRRMYALKAV
ncbi:hypothetical protein ACOME3_004065 [Neoechinorhynchus agilis]